MKLTTVRKYVQGLALVAVLLIPVLESYKRLLRFLPPEKVGMLWKYFWHLSDYAPGYLTGGYLGWAVVLLDLVLGNLPMKVSALQVLLSYFGGSYWSVTIFGLTFLDPVAYLQVLTSRTAVAVNVSFSALIPMVLAAIMGRVFCSWICPVNTINQLNRYFLNQRFNFKAKGLPVLTYPNLRYILLGFGLLVSLAGMTVFPYILPYALLGRFLYYLTTGSIFWIGILIMGAAFVTDATLQKGVWCNYLCPTGALLSLISRFRLLRVFYRPDKCRKNCRLCTTLCEWKADPKVVPNKNCTNCGLCVEKCPGKALSFIPRPLSQEVDLAVGGAVELAATGQPASDETARQVGTEQ
ncbi:MAG TPA: 4Fe-4S binding protein [Bacillota bacterium]|nr:4Fe-4S binding protein [Bacillota bacterium]